MKIIYVCALFILLPLLAHEAHAGWPLVGPPWEREEQQNSPEELSSQDEETPASDHTFEGQGEPE